jgi:putative transposase
MEAAKEAVPVLGVKHACAALELPRASFYRRAHPRVSSPRPPRPKPKRSLSPEERTVVTETLHSKRFVDQAPAEIVASLLDEGTYLCSTRTMYRVLEESGEVRERRDQLRHPAYAKPELLATAPNQVWSWDITKLRGPAKWIYYYLYVILDIFSRYVVGWMLADRESDALARRLIAETIAKEGILPGQLALHADHGPAMTSWTVAQLLAVLGVEKSHSRPHVSDDNPYSEAQFKTMKYQPDFPDRFASQEHGHDFCRGFFPWYNNEHHHSGLAWLTPATVHHGRVDDVLAVRQAALDRAFFEHPERFVRRPPRVARPPEAAWINPPAPVTPAEPVVH